MAPDLLEIIAAAAFLVGSEALQLQASMIDCGGPANCVNLSVDEGDPFFAAASGTMTLESVAPAVGSIENVELVQVTLGNGGTVTPVEGGVCYSIAAADLPAPI